MTEPEDKGYKVEDRRFLHKSEEEKAKIKEEEAARQTATDTAQETTAEAPKDTPLPEITFSSFLISLGSSAFIHLGDIPDPATGEVKKDIPLAKQTIDLLGLLQEKTRNNLLEEEEKLFEHLLYDLRMRYVRETS
ncbi:MAG: DUF1844 domain-containing protein [Syntrophobacterales bacterium]|jgi:hypothetical protein